MAKRPRLTVVEKIKAAQAAPTESPAAPTVSVADLGNLVFAARKSIGTLSAFDMRNVSGSIDAAERLIAHLSRQAQAPAPAAAAGGSEG